VVCIPNGIDLTRFRPADAPERARARRELDLPADRLIVLYCGTFQPLKGTPELVAVWQQLAPDDAMLVLVGEEAGGYRLPFVPGLVVRPWQQDVAAYYRAADVFVLPSRAEGMSNALLEALASGLAVVATRVGAAEALIRDREQGVLVAPGDVGGLTQALRQVLADQELRTRLQNAAPSGTG
jgi:glycosyltransferase involved in cell wall biosynthesis